MSVLILQIPVPVIPIQNCYVTAEQGLQIPPMWSDESMPAIWSVESMSASWSVESMPAMWSVESMPATVVLRLKVTPLCTRSAQGLSFVSTTSSLASSLE